MPRRNWSDMSSVEVAALDAARVIAVLPVAAIEQHGPHLPLSVDADINAGILAQALDQTPEALPVTVLPPLTIGKSDEHADFAGTLTLRAETLLRTLADIGDSLARAGLRKLLLFNSHGGQPQVLQIAAQDLRRRHAMFAVCANSYDLADAEDLFPRDERKHGIHGGAIETSMMLHLRPDLVRMDEARDFVSANLARERERTELWPAGAARFAWMAQDLNPAGAIGNATLADAAKGAKLVARAATRLAALLAEIDRAALPDDSTV